jgi:hypothetical protein
VSLTFLSTPISCYSIFRKLDVPNIKAEIQHFEEETAKSAKREDFFYDSLLIIYDYYAPRWLCFEDSNDFESNSSKKDGRSDLSDFKDDVRDAKEFWNSC